MDDHTLTLSEFISSIQNLKVALTLLISLHTMKIDYKSCLEDHLMESSVRRVKPPDGGRQQKTATRDHLLGLVVLTIFYYSFSLSYIYIYIYIKENK